MLCCADLCRVILRYAVQRYAVQRHAVMRYAVMRYVVIPDAVLCRASCVTVRYAMLCYAALQCTALNWATLSYPMLCCCTVVSKIFPILVYSSLDLDSLVSSFLDKCSIFLMTNAGWHRIFFLNLGGKPATDQMTQNRTFSQSRNQRERKIASTCHVFSSYFLFLFYFTPENISCGNLCVESSSAAFIRYSVNATKCSSEKL